MTYARKAMRQDVKHEAPDKLLCGQPHAFLLAALSIVFVGEDYLLVFNPLDSVMRDGDVVRVAREILDDCLAVARAVFRKDDPLFRVQFFKEFLRII
jgi:hypothetical protein